MALPSHSTRPGRARAARLALFALLATAFVLSLAGCGDTPTEADVEAARPALSIPNDSVTPGESSDEGTTGSTGATGDTGGDTGSGGDTGGTTPNDTGGTNTGGTNNNTGGNNNAGGGQQYDQFCQENPGACGD